MNIKLFNRFDQYLLVHYPRIWTSRVHFVLLGGLLLNGVMVMVLSGYHLQKSYGLLTVAIFLSLLPTQAIFITRWASRYYQFTPEHEYGRSGRLFGLLDFLLIFICISAIVSTSLIYIMLVRTNYRETISNASVLSDHELLFSSINKDSDQELYKIKNLVSAYSGQSLNDLEDIQSNLFPAEINAQIMYLYVKEDFDSKWEIFYKLFLAVVFSITMIVFFRKQIGNRDTASILSIIFLSTIVLFIIPVIFSFVIAGISSTAEARNEQSLISILGKFSYFEFFAFVTILLLLHLTFHFYQSISINWQKRYSIWKAASLFAFVPNYLATIVWFQIYSMIENGSLGNILESHPDVMIDYINYSFLLMIVLIPFIKGQLLKLISLPRG